MIAAIGIFALVVVVGFIYNAVDGWKHRKTGY